MQSSFLCHPGDSISKTRKAAFDKRTAFTLVELLVVIAIIGVLLTPAQAIG